MTREDREFAKSRIKYLLLADNCLDKHDRESLEMAIEALEQEPCEDWYDVPSNEMILERARQASKDLRKRFREDLEQEPCDEYGNYKYPSDIELSEPNTATSMPCWDAISRADAEALFRNARSKLNPSDYKTADEFNTRDLMLLNAEQFIHLLPSVRPQEPKTGEWIPVSERLPEINDDVLISLEWGIDIGRYSYGEWHSEWINNYDDGNVYAWMPLPAPYEPQESEEEE